MKITRRFETRLRRDGVVAFVLVLMALSYLGYADRLVDSLGRGQVATANSHFLAESAKTGLERLVVLSLLRDGLALVSSSEVGISFIVEARVELGAILESTRSFYERAWKISALGVAVLGGLDIALEVARAVSPRLLALFFGLLAVRLVARRRLRWLGRVAGELGAAVLGLTLVAHLLLPLTVFGMSLLSREITGPMARSAHHQMVSEHSELLGASDDADLKSRARTAVERYKSASHGLERRVENLATNATRHLVAGLLDSVVFPVGLFLLLVYLTRRLLAAATLRSRLDALLSAIDSKGAHLRGAALAVALCLLVTACGDRGKQPNATVPTGEPAKGIDVSNWQGVVNWKMVARDGIDFAFAKATQGTSHTDSTFKENWNGMRSMGLYRGAYHFFIASDDATQQAEHFVSVLKAAGSGPRDLPPVLDVEQLDGVSKGTLVSAVLAWLEAVERGLGVRPMLYTDLAFGQEYLDDPRLSAYPLWVADYSAKQQGVPPSWKSVGWAFWQHSERGSVGGIQGAVDLDLYNGSTVELAHLIERQRVSEVDRMEEKIE